MSIQKAIALYVMCDRVGIVASLAVSLVSIFPNVSLSQPIERQILGTWRLDRPGEEDFIGVFTPTSMFFLISLQGEVYELNYQIDSQKKPIEIDFYTLILGKNKPFKSILKTSKDGSITIQDMAQIGEPRPTEFNNRAEVMTRLSTSTKIPTIFPGEDKLEATEITQAREIVVRNIRDINRHQISHHGEKRIFSQSLKELGLSKLENQNRE